MRSFLKLGCVLAAAFAVAGAQADYLLVSPGEGVYRMTGAGQCSRLALGSAIDTNALAVSDYGPIYVIDFPDLLELDPETGATFASVPLPPQTNPLGMTWVSGWLYAILSGTPDRLVTIDPFTGAVTNIGPTGFSGLQSLGSIGSTLYAWDLIAGLVTINSVTGAATDVNILEGGGNIQGLESDPDGRLIAVGGGSWYEVNPATGMRTPATGMRTVLPGSVPMNTRGIVPLRRFERMIGYGTGNRHETDSGGNVYDRGPDGTAVGGAATGPDGWHYITAGNSLYRRNPNSLLTFLVGNIGFPVRALAFRNGVLYAARNDAAAPDRIYTLNTTTAVPTLVGSSGEQNVVGLATQPGTNQLFAFETTLGLCTMNAVTGDLTDVSGFEGGSANIQSLEFFESGILRGAGNGFWGVHPTTGMLTLIPNVIPTGMGGLCLHRKTGRMYGVNFVAGDLLDVDMRTGAATTLASGLFPNANAMTTGEDGHVYAATGGTIYRIDTATNTATSILVTSLSIRGLAALGQDLYAVNNAGTNDELYRINLRHGTSTLVGSMGGNFQSLEVSPYGTMYAYELTDGLHKVNPLTGAATDISGVGAVSTQCLEFGMLDRLYGGQTDLYTYNTPTGLSTLIGPTGTDLRGLAYTYRRAPFEVGLLDYPFGDPADVLVEIQVRRSNTQEVLEVHFVQAGVGSNFNTEQNGQVTISAKGGHWLRKTRNFDITAGPISMNLINGDLDQNNVIDSDDFDIVVANFGGGPTGDLDGNAIVDSDDFDIIVKNFGEVGDD